MSHLAWESRPMAYETIAFVLGELAVALAESCDDEADDNVEGCSVGRVVKSASLDDGHVRLLAGRVANQFSVVVTVGGSTAFVRMVYDMSAMQLLGLQVSDVDGDRAPLIAFARRLTTLLQHDAFAGGLLH